MILYIIGIAIATIGIIIFHPLLTLVGLGLSLTIFLREDTNAQSE